MKYSQSKTGQGWSHEDEASQLLLLTVILCPLQGPGGWDDVLTTRKLHGQCHRTGCNGQDAVSSIAESSVYVPFSHIPTCASPSLPPSSPPPPSLPSPPSFLPLLHPLPSCLYPQTQQEFYFKCANHRTEETEECVALHMVRANTISVECASCLDVE